MMPHMSGIELSEKAKELYPDLEVVVLEVEARFFNKD